MKSILFFALFLVAMVFAEPEPEADPSLGLGSPYGVPALGLGPAGIGGAWGRGLGSPALGLSKSWGNPGLGLGRSAWGGKVW